MWSVWDMIVAFFQQGQNGPDLGLGKTDIGLLKVWYLSLPIERLGGGKFNVMKLLSLF